MPPIPARHVSATGAETDDEWSAACGETQALLVTIRAQREMLQSSLDELTAQRELLEGSGRRNDIAGRSLRRQEETLRGLLIACDRILETGRVVGRRLGLVEEEDERPRPAPTVGAPA